MGCWVDCFLIFFAVDFMKKVMVFGTFDIFHPGHRDFLKQARKHGDYLVVVVARDKTVEAVKKQETRNNEQIRKKVIQESALADEVVLGNLEDKYAVIEKYKPDVICLGYDQEFFVDELAQKMKEFDLKKTVLVRLEPFRPEKYKSSFFK